jgi:hypothetical protein
MESRPSLALDDHACNTRRSSWNNIMEMGMPWDDVCENSKIHS